MTPLVAVLSYYVFKLVQVRRQRVVLEYLARMKRFRDCREFILGDFIVTNPEVGSTLERIILDFAGIVGIREMVSSLIVIVIVKSVQYEGCYVEGPDFVFLWGQG